MPIYEYLCESCGKKFEVLQKFSDEPISIHPDCGGKVEKLISTSALQFKGSGWYVTDYAGKSSAKDGTTAEPSSTDKKDSADGKDSASKESSAPKDSKDKKPAKKK